MAITAIIINKNGYYNDYNKQKWQVLNAIFDNNNRND